jgi:hypothetical protein
LKIFILLCRNPVTVKIKKKTYEGDPHAPPEGEADQGENPLDPLSFFCFWKEFLIILLKIHINP